GPLAIRAPGSYQIRDAARDRGMLGLARRHQAEDGPGGWAGRGFFVAAGWGMPISFLVFAPAAVVALHGDQPVGGSTYRGVVVTEANRVQRAQHRPGAVNVVGAPAAE